MHRNIFSFNVSGNPAAGSESRKWALIEISRQKWIEGLKRRNQTVACHHEKSPRVYTEYMGMLK